jgi:hypothetical protein
LAGRRFDDWVQASAAFSFSELEATADAARHEVGGCVLDPFAGTGKSLTFVTGRGDCAIGIEAHPLVAELAALKLARPGAPEELRNCVEGFSEVARGRVHQTTISDEPQVLKRFIPEGKLRELAAWRDSAESVEGPWRMHLRWLVLGALRDSVGRSWPYPSKRRAAAARGLEIADLVRNRAELMAQDLAAAPRLPTARLIHEDAREPRAWSSLEPGSVDACISSPPYLNQLSYAEMTRLELHFLGVARSWREMSEKVSSRLVASCTQQVNKARAAAAREKIAALPDTSAALAVLSSELESARRARAGGKPYDLLAWSYFNDLRAVLHELRRVLAPGARAAWVIGDSALYDVYVDTPALVGLMADELGFELLEDRYLRERGRKWANVGKRHGRVLSERMLVFRRPQLGSQATLPGLQA